MSERTAVWELPTINGPVVMRSRRATDLDGIEREAFEKGLAEGREAGLAAIKKEQQAVMAEYTQQLGRLSSILDFMSKPLAELDDQVQRQLATLAGAIARQVVRREIRVQPDEIVSVIRETLALLPITAREVRVHLHPDDAKLVRERLAEVSADRAWSLTDDPILSRGGCRVSSENSTIDAQLEQRIGAAIAAVLGDERAGSAEGAE